MTALHNAAENGNFSKTKASKLSFLFNKILEDSKMGKEQKERDIESNYLPNTVQNKRQKIELVMIE